MERKLDCSIILNVNSVKQRAIISSRILYEEKIKEIEKAIEEEANKGHFCLLFTKNKCGRLTDNQCSSILNVFANAGFSTGFKGQDLFISWWDNLDKIDLLEDYETRKTD